MCKTEKNVRRFCDLTEDEVDTLYRSAENPPEKDWLSFVEDIEAYPEHLTHWDMSIPFEEFARLVRYATCL